MEDNKLFIKFTLQKVYLQAETYEQIDYRNQRILLGKQSGDGEDIH